MKKILLLVLILIIAIFILNFIILPKYIYSLDKVSSMLNSATLPKNIHIHETYQAIDSTTNYMDIFIKDDIEYSYQKSTSNNPSVDDIDMLSICDKDKVITIFNKEKIINVHKNENNPSDFQNPYIDNFFILVEMHGLYEYRGIYKYCGKEKINGKKCIKVSMTDNLENETNVNYYYIDLETNLILKVESYSGNNENELKLYSTASYEYYFNSVTDDDIPKFDINNYPDYQYTEW